MKPPRTSTASPIPNESTLPIRGRLLRWRLRIAAGATVLLSGLGLAWAVGLTGLAETEPPQATQLQSALQAAGSLVVYSEFGENADQLWAANPDDPAQRTELGRIDHTLGYGIVPSLSPDGTRVAYTVLSAGAPGGPGAPAELWVLDTRSGQREQLAAGLDLHIAPVWLPDSEAVVVRRSNWAEAAAATSELVLIDMSGAATTIASGAELFPIDFSLDGAALYYASLASGGTDLARAPVGGGAAETLAHLSDGIARDWRLSPDGTRLSYVADDGPQANGLLTAQVMELSTGKILTPLATEGVAQASPIWEPAEGDLTVGTLDADAPDAGAPVVVKVDGTATLGVVEEPLPAGNGFDVPVSWSPEGDKLAVRAFEGSDPGNPGPSWIVIVGTDGDRERLSSRSDVIVAGWLEAQP